jgi:hypothetical protein
MGGIPFQVLRCCRSASREEVAKGGVRPGEVYLTRGLRGQSRDGKQWKELKGTGKVYGGIDEGRSSGGNR